MTPDLIAAAILIWGSIATLTAWMLAAAIKVSRQGDPE